MAKQSIKDLTQEELANKTVLIRVDFNVPIQNGEISNDARIQAAIPTIQFLISKGARCVLASHLGRPKGVDKSLSLAIVGEHLSKLMETPVKCLDDCIGPEVHQAIQSNNDTKLFLLENVRFYPEETQNDVNFSKQLASFSDLFVQDAFGTVHRAHASTEGVSHFLPTYAGLLVEKELKYLGHALAEPQRPFVAIVGGAKVSSKIGVLSHLLTVVDTLIIGGGMAYTFLKAQGKEIGQSICEDDKQALALELLKKAEALGKQIILPKDVVIAEKCEENCETQAVSIDHIPPTHMGLDAGPKSIETFKTAISQAKTVLWNGPLGVFEIPPFDKGTCEIATCLATSEAITIIGGGDSVAAVQKVGQADNMSHISTGGGACLEFLEGQELPGIACIGNK